MVCNLHTDAKIHGRKTTWTAIEANLPSEPFYSFNLMSSNCLQTPPNVLSRFPCSDEFPAEEATCPCPGPD